MSDPGTNFETVRVVRFGPRPAGSYDPSYPCEVVSSELPNVEQANLAALKELGWHRGLKVVRHLAYREESEDPDSMEFFGLGATAGR